MNVPPEEILKNLEPLRPTIFHQSDNDVLIRVHMLFAKIALFSENFDQALESLQSALTIALKIEGLLFLQLSFRNFFELFHFYRSIDLGCFLNIIVIAIFLHFAFYFTRKINCLIHFGSNIHRYR